MQTEVATHAIADPSLAWTVVVAFAISVVTVFALIFGRYEIRLRRLRLIRDYVKTFPVIDQEDDETSPSFEFVRTKYAADVRGNGERNEVDSDGRHGLRKASSRKSTTRSDRRGSSSTKATCDCWQPPCPTCWSYSPASPWPCPALDASKAPTRA